MDRSRSFPRLTRLAAALLVAAPALGGPAALANISSATSTARAANVTSVATPPKIGTAAAAQPSAAATAPADWAWLAQHDPLRVGLEDRWPPFEFVEGDRIQGICRDVVERIARSLGVGIQWTTAGSRADLQRLLLRGELDLLPCSPVDQGSPSESLFTPVFLGHPVVLVAQASGTFPDTLAAGLAAYQGRTVAVATHHGVVEALARDFPRIHLLRAEAVAEGLAAVLGGHAEAFAGIRPAIHHAVWREGYADLRVVAETPYRIDLRMAVRPDAPALAALLSHALARIPAIELAGIADRWYSPALKPSRDWRPFLYGSLGAALVLLAVLYWNRRLAAEVRGRVTSERGLRAERDKFRHYLELGGGLMVLLDGEGRIAALNGSACAALGRAEAALLGEDWFSRCLPPAVAEEARSLFRRVWAGEAEFPLERETPIRRADEDQRLVLWRSALLRDEAGRPQHCLCSGVDITALRRREGWERARNEVLVALARGAPLPEVLEAIALGLERERPDLHAVVLLASADGGELSLAAVGSLPAEALDCFAGIPIAPGQGCCATACLEGCLAVETDAARQPCWPADSQVFRALNLPTCWSQPILSADGQALGTLTVRRRGTESPDAADQDALAEAARLAAIAIEHHRAEGGRRLLEALIEHSDHPVYLVDPADGFRLAYLNSAALRYFGRPRAECLTLRIPSFAPEWDQPRLAALWEEIKRRRHWTYEVRHRIQGRDIPAEITATYLCHEGREYYAVHLRDISERKRAEAALRESEEFLLTVIDTLTSAIAIVNASGIVTYINSAWGRLRGQSRPVARAGAGADPCASADPCAGAGAGADPCASASADPCAGASAGAEVGAGSGDGLWRSFRLPCHDDILPAPTDQEAVAAGIRQILAGERTSFTWDYACHSPERRRWFSLHCLPFAVAGHAKAVVRIEDVTDLRLSVESLQLSATTLETHEAILITDAAGVILRVNRAFAEITGYTEEEARGKTPGQLLHSGYHDQDFYRALWDSLLQIGRWQGEIWNRRKGGELYPEWETISAVRDTDGQITHYVAVFSDISERKAAEERIHQLAFYDPLTGLPNRRLLQDRMGQQIRAYHRKGQFGALLFMDLDHFKNLNDSLGHAFGDQLLVQVATRLRTCLREEDTAARMGGDEFLILLNSEQETAAQAADYALAVAERIRVELSRPFPLIGHSHNLSASIGIAILPQETTTGQEVLLQADSAMYRAKDEGRDAIRFYEEGMRAAATERLALERALREAIAFNEFELYYQPQFDGLGRLMGAEALIRWRHREWGMVPPARFIPLAEESGLILVIGRVVLTAACRLLRQIVDRGLSLPHLSVNVSPRQFQQADFRTQVEQILAETGAPPGRLYLEVTEGMLLRHTEATIARMTALQGLGVRFSIDDFGTGYSSLSYLKSLPLTELKIDRSFIRDLEEDPSDVVITQAIIAIARHLKLEVIAEGVETPGQLAILRECGCESYQGFLFARPMAEADFLAFLERAGDKGGGAGADQAGDGAGGADRTDNTGDADDAGRAGAGAGGSGCDPG
jgi:diguanylate cyclase (GGDEF)-like protein/PAS domain S-box-containing protein